MIVSSGAPRSREVSGEHDAVVVSTPLEAIHRLESRDPIAAVVLAGSYATNAELGDFLAETYPFLQIAREA
ncbi:MAG TPA: hypothetical protein VGO00_26000 [Kofleriaceae bacterium]|nr:hypothetical protein [Kofleriaceae bacterium]